MAGREQPCPHCKQTTVLRKDGYCSMRCRYWADTPLREEMREKSKARKREKALARFAEANKHEVFRAGYQAGYHAARYDHDLITTLEEMLSALKAAA